MNQPPQLANRRQFVTGAAVTAGLCGLNLLTPAVQAKNPVAPPDPDLLVIGPRPGYTPEIGTLVSMLTYIQSAVSRSVDGLSQADLDYLFDAKANTIGTPVDAPRRDRDLLQHEYLREQNLGSWSEEIKKNGTRR